MCFSPEADLVAGAVLVPVGVVSLYTARGLREVPFASLPMLFAAHQLVEALVWGGVEGAVDASVARAAALVYVLVALPLLPFLVPLAVLLLEPRGRRLRVAGFAVLGVAVAARLLVAVLDHPLTVVAQPHALQYDVDLGAAAWWAGAYVVAVVGPSLLSGYRSIVAFGAANLVGLVAVALLYAEAFASLWCVWAAVSSVLVVVHLRRRRRYVDPDVNPRRHAAHVLT